MSKKPCIYTVPAGASFVDVLAKGIYDEAGSDPLALARIRILLPTRRACRSLRDAFLRITKGKPLLLPRMSPIGDVDEEELSLLFSGAERELELRPAIAPLHRLFLLTRMIGGLATHSRGLEQDMALAAALARLMDQIYTEDLDLKDLPSLVDNRDFADHWQISIAFLNILSENWPKILTENGVMDAADRRNQLLKKLADDWEKNPPSERVIAAGSTGSIRATARLLKVVAGMPDGCIVLPGLDQTMDKASWTALDDTHPQATLRHLLSTLEKEREEVALWPAAQDLPASPMVSFASEVMRPSETAQEWQSLKTRQPVTKDELNFERYDCASPQEEALVIALALRESLEQEGMTAALVTPDRKLARRVAMACRRWGIEIDDSAGEPLAQTTVGTYLRLCMEVITNGVKPVSLLNFSKHVLCQPLSYPKDWRSDIRKLDRDFLRGPLLGDIFTATRKKLDESKTPKPDMEQLLTYLEASLKPLTRMIENGEPYALSDWCEAHLEVAETFCNPDILWSEQDGEAAAILMADLREQASVLPPLTAAQYLSVLETCMQPLAVRPAYGLHPRLMILGQLEARLVKTDLMILGGLNEGTWPPEAGIDPWMSRPMRKRFGLPSLERSIGLAAHDFVQGLCAKKVLLTRSVRVDGAPTVPSRWLQRMDTVLEASGIDAEEILGTRLLSFARQIDHTDDYTPWDRPKPTPPVNVRPKELPVTQIETWMRDPYSLYASHILRLKKLRPLEQEIDAALRGTLIHDALKKFTLEYPDDIPSHALKRLMEILDEELSGITTDAAMIALWRPRLIKIAEWFIEKDREQRVGMKPVPEVKGMISFDVAEGPFTLTARADRIDVARDGSDAAIIDYKSGGQYSLKGMKIGTYPQLPLEALILEGNGFPNLVETNVSALSYWIINGSKTGGEIKKLSKPLDLETAKLNAHRGLESLIRTFYREDTPYYSLPHPENAPRFNDYEHLARVLEWTALDEWEDAA